MCGSIFVDHRNRSESIVCKLNTLPNGPELSCGVDTFPNVLSEISCQVAARWLVLTNSFFRGARLHAGLSRQLACPPSPELVEGWRERLVRRRSKIDIRIDGVLISEFAFSAKRC